MRDDDELLTTEELAAVRRIPASRLHKERCVKNSGPPFMKDANLVRYRWGDYREWLEKQPRYNSSREAD